MDDIIVIILTLIFIVAGIFGQRKKKPPVPQPQMEPQHGEDDFWDMLEADPTPIRPATNEPVSSKTGIEKKSFSENKYDFKPENEGARVTKRNLPQRDEIKKELRTTKKRKFPLKEAVIYSEILHRKYI